MYADRSDKTKPVFYLEKAAKSPDVDKRLYYFLGLAYQMNYQFTDAIEAFEKFLFRFSELADLLLIIQHLKDLKH